jgi:hypothetical protein
MGHSVAIIDKGIFPRHKTCASWINALAFSRFDYLSTDLTNLVDCPFYGIVSTMSPWPVTAPIANGDLGIPDAAFKV